MADNHIIKIFVSSTFSDMHRERDLLRPIEGLINKDIEYTGYSIQLIDLRYGIDTSECDEKTAEKKVLDRCFSAIDDCQLFVLFLGDRYGTVFDNGHISEIPLPFEEAEGKSVTHLELTYGSKTIEPENILILVRKVNNNAEIPEQYKEPFAESVKVQELKNGLYANEKYKIDEYDAEITDGEYHIDEYYFNKHAQGILETMVLDYISKNAGDKVPASGADSGAFTKDNNAGLELLIRNKSAEINADLKAVYEKMVHMRIEELLNKADFAEIAKMGGSGKDQLEYRKKIVEELPADFEGLFTLVCNLISGVIGEIDGEDIRKALYFIAYAKNNKMLGAGLSSEEIEVLGLEGDLCGLKPEDPSGIWGYDECLKHKEEETGLTHQPAPVSRALAYFMRYDIIVYTAMGYFVISDQFSEYLTASRHYDVSAFEEYWYKVWWFFPGRMQFIAGLLEACRYDCLHDRLEAFSYSEEPTEIISSYLSKALAPETLEKQIEDYLCWCVDHNKAPQHVIYVLFHLYYPEGEETFEKQWVPLCEKIYNKYKDTEERSLLTDYTVKYLYDRFSVEQASPQQYIRDEAEYDDLEALSDALWEMFFFHDFNGEEDLNDYKEALSVIKKYIGQWEDLCDIFQIMKITQHAEGFDVIYNFLPVFLEGTITAGEYQLLSGKMLLSAHYFEELIEDGISLIEDYIMEPLMQNDHYDEALSIFHTLYRKIKLEGYVRCCEWTQWIYYMHPEQLRDLYKKTKDEVLRHVIGIMDDYFFASPEELEAIDRGLLENVTIGDTI